MLHFRNRFVAFQVSLPKAALSRSLPFQLAINYAWLDDWSATHETRSHKKQQIYSQSGSIFRSRIRSAPPSPHPSIFFFFCISSWLQEHRDPRSTRIVGEYLFLSAKGDDVVVEHGKDKEQGTNECKVHQSLYLHGIPSLISALIQINLIWGTLLQFSGRTRKGERMMIEQFGDIPIIELIQSQL